ncbi:MAG: glycosyltransferase family 4 protein [Bacteroidetes bacterium]|nr:glycosyltransferase family 4 protein [Bacteroidota bacterium]
MKLLFISNEATRTGAPIVLLTFLEWLKKMRKVEIYIIFLFDGELEERFKATGKTLFLHRKRGKFGTYFRFGLKEVVPFIPETFQHWKIKMFLRNFSPDLIYTNTILSAKILKDIITSEPYPVICHIHESETAIWNYLGVEGFTPFVKYIDKYITVAKIHSRMISACHHIREEKIDMIYPHIQKVSSTNPMQDIRKKLNISPDIFLVLGCGTPSWYKSPEIFVITAKEVAKRTGRIFKFIWIGSYEQPGFYRNLLPDYYRQVLYDIEKSGLKELVEFKGYQENPFDYYAVCDLFFLSSREDSFPLVCLEAASFGKPVICFDKSGGMPEFVKDDAGFVVPYLDITAAADRIVQLMENPGLRESLGKTGQQRVSELHYIETTGPKIFSAIEKTIREKTN